MPKINEHVFIDESGDPGLTEKSSRFFVMAAIIVDDKNILKINEIMDDYRKKLKWNILKEFKHSKTKKEIIKDLILATKKASYEIEVLKIDKANFKNNGKMTVYNQVLIKLLKNINRDDIDITIDGRKSKKYIEKLSSDIRKNTRLKLSAKNIHFIDSNKNNLIQLADLIAGENNK